VTFHGKMSEKFNDLSFTPLEIVPLRHSVVQHVSLDPFAIGSLGMDRIVVKAHHISNFVEKPGWLFH
jgi:hypothetical protein